MDYDINAAEARLRERITAMEADVYDDDDPPAPKRINGPSIKMESAAVGDAHQAQEMIRRASNRLSAGFIILARRLYEFNRARQWETLGFDSFTEWAESSGYCPVGAETARQAIRIYETLVITLNIPAAELGGIGIAKYQIIMAGLKEQRRELALARREADGTLDTAIDITEAREDALELIAVAKTTSKSELRKRVGEDRGIVTLVSQFVPAGWFTAGQRSLLGLTDLGETEVVHILIRSGLDKQE